MWPAEPTGPLYNTFEIETELGKRRLEFDPDVILGRDVRILVGGIKVAATPYPKPATPFHEVAFAIDGHPLEAAVWLPPESDSAGLPLGYDVFEGGRSLSGRQPLTEVRSARSTPRKRYPTSFVWLDNVVRIVPFASAPGLVVGLGRGVGTLGLPRTIALGVFLISGIGVGATACSRIWLRLRAREDLSERRRATLGWMSFIGTYAVTVLALVALIVTYIVVSTPR